MAAWLHGAVRTGLRPADLAAFGVSGRVIQLVAAVTPAQPGEPADARAARIRTCPGAALLTRQPRPLGGGRAAGGVATITLAATEDFDPDVRDRAVRVLAARGGPAATRKSARPRKRRFAGSAGRRTDRKPVARRGRHVRAPRASGRRLTPTSSNPACPARRQRSGAQIEPPGTG